MSIKTAFVTGATGYIGRNVAFWLGARAGRGIVIHPAIVYGRNGRLSAHFFQEQPLVGEGRNHRPLVHVDRLADAYVLAAEHGGARGTWPGPGSAAHRLHCRSCHFRGWERKVRP